MCDGQLRDHFNRPTVSVSPEFVLYICDYDNHRVTVHDEEGMFRFAFGSKGNGPGCFDGPRDITFGSDGLVYVTECTVCYPLAEGVTSFMK